MNAITNIGYVNEQSYASDVRKFKIKSQGDSLQGEGLKEALTQTTAGKVVPLTVPVLSELRKLDYGRKKVIEDEHYLVAEHVDIYGDSPYGVLSVGHCFKTPS